MVVLLLLHSAIFIACAVTAVAQCTGRAICCGPLTINIFCRESVPEFNRMKSILFRDILNCSLPKAIKKASLMRPRVLVESRWITLKGLNRFLKMWRDGKIPRKLHLTINWPPDQPMFTAEKIEKEMLKGMQFLEGDEHLTQPSSYKLRDQIALEGHRMRRKEQELLMKAAGRAEVDGDVVTPPRVHMEHAYEVLYDGITEMPTDFLFAYISFRHIPDTEVNYVESDEYCKIKNKISIDWVPEDRTAAGSDPKPQSPKLLQNTGTVGGETEGGGAETEGGEEPAGPTTRGGPTIKNESFAPPAVSKISRITDVNKVDPPAEKKPVNVEPLNADDEQRLIELLNLAYAKAGEEEKEEIDNPNDSAAEKQRKKEERQREAVEKFNRTKYYNTITIIAM